MSSRPSSGSSRPRRRHRSAEAAGDHAARPVPAGSQRPRRGWAGPQRLPGALRRGAGRRHLTHLGQRGLRHLRQHLAGAVGVLDRRRNRSWCLPRGAGSGTPLGAAHQPQSALRARAPSDARDRGGDADCRRLHVARRPVRTWASSAASRSPARGLSAASNDTLRPLLPTRIGGCYGPAASRGQPGRSLEQGGQCHSSIDRRLGTVRAAAGGPGTHGGSRPGWPSSSCSGLCRRRRRRRRSRPPATSPMHRVVRATTG